MTDFWNKIPLKFGQSGKTQTICPACSHTRSKKNDKCLSVDIDTGHYHCSHCGTDGWREDKFKPMEEKKPVELPKLNTTDLSEKTFKYLNEVRMISTVTIKRNKITEGLRYMPQTGKEMNCIWFNYYVNGNHVNTKFRDGQKNFTQVGGAEKHFYGIDDVAGEYAIIVEGEFDKLSWEEAGYLSCVSVPDGALKADAKYSDGKMKYIDNDIESFDTIAKIYLCTDNDAPGLGLRKELSRRFGRERCWIVDLGEYKDANEVLQKLGRVDGVEYLKKCFSEAQPYPIEGSKAVSDYKDDVFDMYLNGIDEGYGTGYKILDEHMRWLKGLLYLITGVPSHGKSSWLDQMIIKMIAHDWKFAIYSPEHSPKMHLQRLASQIVGKPFSVKYSHRMDVDELQAALNLLDKYIYFITPEEDFTIDNVLEIATQRVRRNGVCGLVIDPWNTLDHTLPRGVDKNDFISQSIGKLNRFKQLNDCSVFLVAHPTKMPKNEDGTYKVPTGYSISDSAHFYNKADIGITIYRDFERKTTEAHIWKVKFEGDIGKQGVCYFSFDVPTQTYKEVSLSETKSINNLKTDDDDDVPF